MNAPLKPNEIPPPGTRVLFHRTNIECIIESVNRTTGDTKLDDYEYTRQELAEADIYYWSPNANNWVPFYHENT